jgi:hypothetical protein
MIACRTRASLAIARIYSNTTETISAFGTSAATTFLAMNRRLITATFLASYHLSGDGRLGGAAGISTIQKCKVGL